LSSDGVVERRRCLATALSSDGVLRATALSIDRALRATVFSSDRVLRATALSIDRVPTAFSERRRCRSTALLERRILAIAPAATLTWARAHSPAHENLCS
jgi:rRNA-processing protein FCF1